jgi:dTDP-4-amino-4,6-dideoxygalactose transaminase
MKLFKPYVSWRARLYALRVLLSDQLAEGSWVKQFEYEFGKRFGLSNVLALNSGTSALELAYELAGIGEGDEVITPVLTCTATNLPLIHRHARIVFADVDYDLNINIEDVKKKITPRTKAIVFVHFGGNNRGLEELLRLCKDSGITLIEDAAQAVGSDYWGKADFCAVSLQAIKTLTAGDGGFLITKRREDYEKGKRLRWFGYDREEKQKKGDTDLVEAGYKYHMNNISAAIGLGNLRSIDKVIAHRKKLMAIYQSYGFSPGIWMTTGLTPLYSIMKDSYARMGVEIGQHHYRNDKYTIFKQFKSPCPVMDEIEHNYFFVPMHHKVSEKLAHKIGNLYAPKH